ncbi:interferon-inducible GTPase 5-like [Carettochelys insculpta]|uniref:interferon-inducible GTPase 5-like n=1 Tax=Carettochelys insculpta TaxID=44489 RepID=UPI003EC03ECE
MDLEHLSTLMKGLESVSTLMKGLESVSTLMEALDPKELFNGSIKVFEEFMDLFKDKGRAEVASLAQEKLESFSSIVLNIAVTGETGAGKSSFINALRGLMAEDDGAAPTGVTETTMQPTVYPYPQHPNVKLWELPSIGGPNFQARTYLRQVNFKHYDFFVIVASERFKCSHANLAREFEGMGKRFYFVRSKVDEDLRNEERVLAGGRVMCGEVLPWVSNPESSNRLPLPTPAWVGGRDRRAQLNLGASSHAMASTLRNYKQDTQFRESLNRLPLPTPAWLRGLISVASVLVNVIPIPRLSVACDISPLLGTMIGFYKHFDLHDRSLATLARQCGKPIAELKAVMRSPGAKEIKRDVVIKLLLKEQKGLPRLTANLPVIGPLLTAGISFLTTYRMLSSFLDEVVEDAERVRQTALEEDLKKLK